MPKHALTKAGAKSQRAHMFGIARTRRRRPSINWELKWSCALCRALEQARVHAWHPPISTEKKGFV